MTTLPERLRASAQEMRGLFLVSENVPNVRMIYKEDRDRIARELEEAAQALEAGPLDALLTQILNRRVTVEQRMFDAASGKRPMPDAAELRAWAIELGTPAAQVAQEGGKPWPFTGCSGPLTDCDMPDAPGVTLDGGTK